MTTFVHAIDRMINYQEKWAHITFLPNEYCQWLRPGCLYKGTDATKLDPFDVPHDLLLDGWYRYTRPYCFYICVGNKHIPVDLNLKDLNTIRANLSAYDSVLCKRVGEIITYLESLGYTND